MRWERHGRFGPIRASLRAKVTLGVLLPLLIILGGITAGQLLRHRTVVLDSASLIDANFTKVIEQSLRHEIMESHFDSAQSLLDAIGNTGQFHVVYLLDTEGRVIFAPNGEGVGQVLSNEDPDCQPCHSLEEEERPGSVVVTLDNGERIFRSMVPMENEPECAECHETEGDEPLAVLLTDTPMTELEASLQADFWENLIWLASAVLVTVIVVNLALNQLVLKRIKLLGQALAGFGRGRHDVRLAAGDPDEIGQLVDVFNEMGQQVEAEEAENRTLSEDLHRQSALRGQLLERLITAQEDERKRLAREIHDEWGQAMGGLALQAELLQRFIPAEDEAARAQLAQMKSLVTATTDSMYDMILAIRPSALDDLGLAAALRAHAERTLANTGIRFEMDAAEFDGRLPPELETTLYRMFQEALHNVTRHASAKKVYFRLARQDGWFEGRIKDDGRGFNPEDSQLLRGDKPRGLGLLGMKERVAQFGGELKIESQYGGGTCVRIMIPLEEGD
ncbi:MAG: ATP-binding protein [Anaerolineae bacterium]